MSRDPITDAHIEALEVVAGFHEALESPIPLHLEGDLMRAGVFLHPFQENDDGTSET